MEELRTTGRVGRSNATQWARRETQGHIGLVVLASIVTGLALGLLLILGAFAGGDEPRIIGGALLALGVGFAFLAIASSRFTSQPQTWAVKPGFATTVIGLAIALFADERRLDLAGWVWPCSSRSWSSRRFAVRVVHSTTGRGVRFCTRRLASCH